VSCRNGSSSVVGGIRTIPVNIRLIAATNKDLEKAVEDGEFRRDLYYRLNVVSLEMPPLRLRREDFPMLAEYFSRKYSSKSVRESQTNFTRRDGVPG
jgi:two-component system NtrC family response regulator